MGLLDSLAGQVLGSLGGEGGSSNQGAVLLQLASEFLGKQGGLQNLVDAFDSKGLGGIIGSWISTGQNQPISPEQVNSVLGDKLQNLAQHSGSSPQELSTQLSQLLPQIIDQLTPDGKLPEGGPSLGSLLGVLGQLNR